MTRAKGIDLSVNNRADQSWDPDDWPLIDWEAVKNSGHVFVIFRASAGDDYVDPFTAKEFPRAGEAGMLRGLYHFWRYWENPKTQAQWFHANVPSYNVELGFWWDVEPFQCPYPTTTVENLVRTGIGEAEILFGEELGIYTGKYVFQDEVGRKLTWAGRRKLWHAQYTTWPEPDLADSWDDWFFWQYTEKGSCPGVHDPDIDLNRFNGTVEELFEWAKVEPPLTIEQRLAKLEAMAHTHGE